MEIIPHILLLTGVVMQLVFFVYALVLENKGQYPKATFYAVCAIFFLLLTRLT